MSDYTNWTPEERERLEQELLELHFDCHEDPTALEDRLRNEPALRELLGECGVERVRFEHVPGHIVAVANTDRQ